MVTLTKEELERRAANGELEPKVILAMMEPDILTRLHKLVDIDLCYMSYRAVVRTLINREITDEMINVVVDRWEPLAKKCEPPMFGYVVELFLYALTEGRTRVRGFEPNGLKGYINNIMNQPSRHSVFDLNNLLHYMELF